MNSLQEMDISICSNRKALYAFLAHCFLNAPTSGMTEKIDAQKALFREMANDETLFSEERPSDDVSEYLQEYYDRFFVTSSDAYVPPFEYSIRNRKTTGGTVKFGSLNSSGSFHVQDCYQLVGFDPTKLEMFEPLRTIRFPDHFPFEVSFMAYMLSAEEECRRRNDPGNVHKWLKLQQQFLEEHLTQWVGDFAALARAKRRGLYSDLLAVVAAFMASDAAYLNETMSH